MIASPHELYSCLDSKMQNANLILFIFFYRLSDVGHQLCGNVCTAQQDVGIALRK